MPTSTPETAAPESERTVTHELLKALTPQWLELRYRYEDRSDGLDAQLGQEYHGVNKVMNGLLEQYFALGAGDGIAC